MNLVKVDAPRTVKTPATHRKQWLAELANRYHWQTGAELGLRKGETMFYLLDHCPQLEMIGVDLWAEQPDNPGIEKYDLPHLNHDYWAAQVMERAAQHPRATVIRDYTDNAAELVEDGCLDFVFIDADHCRVAADIEAWRPKLAPGGKLCGHDINWQVVKDDVDRLVKDYHVGPDNCWLEK